MTSSDEHLDVLAELNLALDDVASATGVAEEKLEELFEKAEGSIAFCQSLWQLFIDQGLITDQTTPDFYVMEKVIDGLYGEIAAITLMLSEPSFGMDEHLEGMIALFDNTGNAMSKVPAIPKEVVNGFRSFANRLKNAQTVKKAALAQYKSP